MNWISYFDRVFVTSSYDSKRRLRVVEDFKRYGIPFGWNYACHDEDGKKGIYKSLMEVFRMCIYWEYSRVILFEDDCWFKVSPDEFNSIMNRVCEEATSLDWLQLKMGSVLIREPEEGLVTPNLFRIPGSYGLHACAYTREFMELALSLPMSLPIDVDWMKNIESLGRSYHTYPLLCSQYPGYSSIEKKETNWDFNIMGTFNKYTKKIKEQYESVSGNHHDESF